ncbi:MAG TPA: transporter suffix domain-containing protein [Nostocaceae cyanobacterium]|nr:transporter suffix domain-containing protein [Nostocaceae cyanobacterium]
MQKLGLILIGASFLPWLGIVLILSFLSLPAGQKALVVPILFVCSEGLFWLGLYFAGKELAQKYKRYFSLQYLWQQFNKLFLKKTQEEEG